MRLWVGTAALARARLYGGMGHALRVNNTTFVVLFANFASCVRKHGQTWRLTAYYKARKRKVRKTLIRGCTARGGQVGSAVDGRRAARKRAVEGGSPASVPGLRRGLPKGMVLQGLVGTLWGYGSLRLVLSRPPAMGVWCAWPEHIPTIPYLPRNRKPVVAREKFCATICKLNKARLPTVLGRH